MPPISGENETLEGQEPTESVDTNTGSDTDFASGFESDVEDFVSDLPPDAGAGEQEAQPGATEADPNAGAPGADQQQGQDQQQQQQGDGQQPQPSQEQSSDQSRQDQLLGLDSRVPLDQLLQTLVQNEGQVAEAAAKLFQLSEADKEALETDAAAAMPHLASKVYVKSLQAATSLVRNMVPQMLQQEMNKQESLRAVEQAFFTQFPELDRWQHGHDIVAVGQALRAQNPNMPPRELLQRIASAVMGMHGIQRRPPARRGNGQQPFRPAQSGPSHGNPNPALEMPFMGLGMDFDE